MSASARALFSLALFVAALAPGKSRLDLSWRTASTPEALALQPWIPLADDAIPLRVEDRHLQYRVLFLSDNGDRYPQLDRLQSDFNRSVNAPR